MLVRLDLNLIVSLFQHKCEVSETVSTTTLVERDVHEVISVLRDEASQTNGLTFRELQDLDKALQTIRGQLVFNLAKLSKLDEEISDLQKSIEDAEERGEEVEELCQQLRKNKKW